MTTSTLQTFTHNGYNGGQRQADSFRIGHTAYRVWTLAGFWLDELRTFRDQVAANVARVERGEANALPLYALRLPDYAQTREGYIAEQIRRGSAVRGASPQASVLVGDRAEGARRADAFHALPVVAWGEHVLIDGAEFVVTRGPNDHVRFTEVG